MSTHPPKAQSVRQDGSPDGFTPPDLYARQVVPGGFTRVRISVGPDKLAAVHQDLAAVLQGPLKVLYVQLTDRQKGQLPKPVQLVGVEVEPAQLLGTLRDLQELVYADGRHQLWIKGAGTDEQLVLDELGVIYAYPDDLGFHDVCARHGLREDDGSTPTMAERDYVKVNFVAAADAQEAKLVWTLGLREWEG
ncbi:MAG: hypothetical protein H6742_07615 [Alphaproteobacteria bacterium]|nr:hypothetical protein [Alphaproteobacteria bacterium]